MKTLAMLIGIGLSYSGVVAADNLNLSPNNTNPNANVNPYAPQNPNTVQPDPYAKTKPATPDTTTPYDTTNNPFNK